MSIASAISSAQTKVENAYTAVSNKGGTLPVTQDLSNLPAAITSIPTGGGSGVINSLSITPTTSAQTITASGGVDGYSPVSVEAVTSSIDANIAAGNIKDGVTILGVTGNVVELRGETKIITPRTYAQTVYPTNPNNGITQVTVPAVTNTIDANIVAGNIKDGVTILGVTGAYTGGGYPEIPSYKIDNTGNASRRVLTLTGAEFSNITAIDSYGLAFAFYACGISGNIDLSNLTTVGASGLEQAFDNCVGLTGGIDISSLTVIDGSNALRSAFNDCTNITSVNLSSLTTISGQSGLGNAFYGCTSLASADVSALTTISNTSGMNSTFRGTGLISVSFPALEILTGGNALANAFNGCSNLTSLSFPALTTTSFGTSTNQFNNMVQGVTGCTVHFPSNLSSAIGSWASVTAGFGGTNTTVLFDLPATS